MKTYSIREIAQLFKKDIKTIQRWDKTVKFIAKRTPTNRRFYTQEQVNEFLGFPVEVQEKIAYVRVSSRSQKPDLKNQVKVVPG